MKTATPLILLVLLLLLPAHDVAASSASSLPQGGSQRHWNSCAAPAADQVQPCRAIEARLLASTVRLEVQGRVRRETDGKNLIIALVAHATVKDGRYLVTHNHFSFPLTPPLDGTRYGVTSLSLYDATGRPLLLNVLPSDYRVVVETAQAQVLDFGTVGAQGRLAALGVPSAPFLDGTTLALGSQTELAQVNWDGRRATVQWVTVEQLEAHDGYQRLELSGFIQPGSSGGGVFWNGYHIANNLSYLLDQDPATGTVLRRYSAAALNGPPLLAQTR